MQCVDGLRGASRIVHKRDVLFLCQYFWPEKNSSATLPFDTARFLAEKGYSVDVFCGYPKEYIDQEEVLYKETVDGIHIQRMRYIQLDRKKKLSRLVNYFSFTFAALMRVFKLHKYKCVITYSNPPVLPFVPALANLLFGTRFCFVVYDVYPEIAYASETIRRGDLIDRVAKGLNTMVYKRASMVVALTDEMKEFLLQHRKQLSSERIYTIQNWAHEESAVLATEVLERGKELDERFTITYLGNMGICQDMETICGVIERLKNHSQIQFRLVGHGNKREAIKEHFADYNNVQVLGYLTGEELHATLKSSTCFVVSLEKGLKGLCAPSKYYSYLLAGKPVIAIVEKESYLMREVHEEKIGIAVENGSVDELLCAIQSMAQDSEKTHEMGQRAYALYMDKYCKTKAFEKYEQVVKDNLS